MFGFLLRKKRDDVQTLFAGFMNRYSVQRIQDGPRETTRGAFCQIVWLIPLDEESGEPEFAAAIPVVTKDICREGIALLHTQPMHDEKVMIGISGDVSMKFVSCRFGHCSPLGYGFYSIGLKPVELINVTTTAAHQFFLRQREFETGSTPTNSTPEPSQTTAEAEWGVDAAGRG